jgi:leader peptidase (prepilin peptidase) / N-methyltransferase
MEGIATAFFGVLGLLIGSFLNVLIYRLPRGEDFVQGRSHCPSCGHDLGPADLVPVFSYLLLGRRCRYCRTPISSRYAIVEILTAILFGFSWFFIGTVSPAGFALTAGLLSVSIVMLFIWIDRNRIPRVLFWIAGGFAAGLGLLVGIYLGSRPG